MIGFACQEKQRIFCQNGADIAIYGGAAGSGKSYALLYKPIFSRHIEIKGYYAVIFRRTSPEITNPGGLWDEAGGIYPSFRGVPKVGALEYHFPTGSRVAFRHLQHAETVYSWHGAQICGLFFDELAFFDESQFWYLLSRNRSTCGIRPYVRCTCNPDPGWVKTLLAPWVDEEFAGERAESGEIRHFVRRNGALEWVPEGTPDAKSLTFIRASIYDNQRLLEANPEYLATLKALPEVERMRLLEGDWTVRREGLVYRGFEACLVESPPRGYEVPRVGGVDFGWNAPFAAVWGHLDHDDVLWITGMRYERETTIDAHAEALPRGVRWHCDPAQPESIFKLRKFRHDALACVHRPARGASGEVRKPILAGIDMVSERIRTARLRIVRPACRPLVRELGMYGYEPGDSEEPIREEDHATDALRYLIVGIDRHKSIPGITRRAAAEDLERARLAAAREAADREERQRLAHEDPDSPVWWVDDW